MKTSVGLWVLTVAFAVVTFGQQIWGTNYNTVSIFATLQLIFIFTFVCWHSIKQYGLKTASVFFFVVQIVGNTMENIGVLTGFPFGHYYYAHQAGMPFLFQVPILTGIEYFVYGYLAWTIANILLNKCGGMISRFYIITLPVAASFIMVMWDMVMDPINSTIGHNWIWINGGVFNGVPLTNFLGWFLTTYLSYQIFAIYLRKWANDAARQDKKSFFILPVLIYIITGVSYILMYILAGNGSVADATGHIWSVKGIYETAAIMCLFGMILPSFLALVKLFKPEKQV